MLKKTIKLSIVLFIYMILCIGIYNHFTLKKAYPQKISVANIIKNSIPFTKNINKQTSSGLLIIDKIKLKNELYRINDKENNIEENVTILEGSSLPKINNHLLILAAHSGSGKKAFFKDLNKLEKEDVIKLTYDSINYEYIVEKIWETKKNGSITIPKSNNSQLVLTTCSPTKDDYQLIINCIKKNETT